MFPAKLPVPEDGQQTALLISPAEEDHETLQHLFQHHGWSLQVVECLDSAMAALYENPVFLVITERDLPGGNWKDVLRTITGLPRPPLVIVISQLADDYLWAEALNLGVYDVLAKPLVQAEVARVLTSAWIKHLTAGMHEARRAYKEAAAHYKKTEAQYNDMMNHPDGTSTLRRAAENEQRASERYNKAVNAYSAFVLRNQIPAALVDAE
jgi:DNA-binding NtrC family response regulator